MKAPPIPPMNDSFLAEIEKSAKRAAHEEVWTPVGCASPFATLMMIERIRAAEKVIESARIVLKLNPHDPIQERADADQALCEDIRAYDAIRVRS